MLSFYITVFMTFLWCTRRISIFPFSQCWKCALFSHCWFSLLFVLSFAAVGHRLPYHQQTEMFSFHYNDDVCSRSFHNKSGPHISYCICRHISGWQATSVSIYSGVLLATYLFEIGSYNSFLEAKRYAKLQHLKQHLIPEEMT